MDEAQAQVEPIGNSWPRRRLILLDGVRDRGLRAAAELIAKHQPERLVWVSNASIPDAIACVNIGAHRRLVPEAIPPAKVQRLLGGECDLLVMDLWTGVDADALGAAVGSLRGGGLLLLLTPGLADWPSWEDPEAARIAVHPYSAAEVGTRFIARLSRLLLASDLVERADRTRTDGGIDARHREAGGQPWSETGPDRALEPGQAFEPGAERSTAAPIPADKRAAIANIDSPKPEAKRTRDLAQPATVDQAEAITAICQLAAGRSRRPLVLTADRGRGKSAALGIAAGRLIAKQPIKIVITAPRRSAVDTLFEHAWAALGAASAAEADSLLRFVAPDTLLATTPVADLLLIDEAAGIPAPLLEQLLMHYRRICFATTVHGYEGSGRGFDIRFRALLDQRTPGWKATRLQTPIRWRKDDPLETLINQVLLLDAEPASDIRVAATDCAAAQFKRHERRALAANESLLRQVFGLLLLGHYQTRPNDLRHLLDGPNLAVASLQVGDLVLATALIAQEGRLESALIQPIFEGRRRPRGHLLPQTLSAHAGLREAPRLGYARVVRIAVHPAAQRRGLGRGLLKALATQARRDGLDLLGASFGASAELLNFWHRSGLEALHLGTGRNAASGARAAVVLQALSSAGRDLVAQARQRLERDLPTLLSGPLQSAAPDSVASLLQALPRKDSLIDAVDLQQIDAFANAHRTIEAALPALERLVRERLAGSIDDLTESRVSRRQRDLLILSILQRRSPDAVITALRLSGRAALVQALREAVAALLARSEHPG